MIRKCFCLAFIGCLMTFLAVTGIVIAEDDLSTSEANAETDSEGNDIQLVLKPTYKIGEKIEFTIRNVSKVSYAHNQKYPACDFSYFDSEGREIMIPQGFYCDKVVTTEIKPGETQKLFEWDGTECVMDASGCGKREPLPAGKYTIKGTFVESLDQDHQTESFATIELIK